MDNMKIITTTIFVICLSSIFNLLAAQATNKRNPDIVHPDKNEVIIKSGTKKSKEKNSSKNITSAKRNLKIKNNKKENPVIVDSTNVASNKRLPLEN